MGSVITHAKRGRVRSSETRDERMRRVVQGIKRAQRLDRLVRREVEAMRRG